MALPAIDLTWDYTKINQALAATGVQLSDNKQLVLAEKNGMKGFTANAWTVTSSNDGAGGFGNNDNVDRWATVANLTWAPAGTNHSWIVLKNSQMGAGNFQVCINLSSTSAVGNVREMIMSPNAGFTGGTATARPTATDEQIIISLSGAWGLGGPSAVKLHQYASSDGKQYRLVAYAGGIIKAAVIIGTPKTPTSGWTNPVFWWASGSSTALDLATLCTVTPAPMHSRINAADAAIWMTSEGWGASTFGGAGRLATNNPLDSNSYPLFPIGLASETGGAEGRQGLVYDLWWGLTINGNGDTYPNDATRQFVQHGDLVFPNNGSAILTS
jgi:hypothetical protein